MGVSLCAWTKSPSLSELSWFTVRFDRLADNVSKLQVFSFAQSQISLTVYPYCLGYPWEGKFDP